MKQDLKRLTSLGVVALFCLLCLGTSRPKPGSSTGGPVGVKPAPTTTSSAPIPIAHSRPVEGRIDPLDPKLPDDPGRYDAFVLQLSRAKKYRVRVGPGKGHADAGVEDADAGADAGTLPLWFGVRVMRGAVVAPEQALTVQERVRSDGITDATFKTSLAGPYTVVVTAYFGETDAAQPGFSTYALEVTPVEAP